MAVGVEGIPSLVGQIKGGLVLPLARASKGLTTTSLGSCDAADYAAGARVLIFGSGAPAQMVGATLRAADPLATIVGGVLPAADGFVQIAVPSRDHLESYRAEQAAVEVQAVRV